MYWLSTFSHLDIGVFHSLGYKVLHEVREGSDVLMPGSLFPMVNESTVKPLLKDSPEIWTPLYKDTLLCSKYTILIERKLHQVPKLSTLEGFHCISSSSDDYRLPTSTLSLSLSSPLSLSLLPPSLSPPPPLSLSLSPPPTCAGTWPWLVAWCCC